jgi:O-methyltransferase involved in polyketide biosynthesis
MPKKLKESTVQNTLCIPLWGRMLAAEKYPELFPDYAAKHIIKEIGCDLSGSSLFKYEYASLNCAMRQYDLSCEINEYLKSHADAVIVELGAGLSTLRCQMKNETSMWYNLDMGEVILLREKYLQKGEHEKNIICNLNDFSWLDLIDFSRDKGIVFVAGGLFYYFETDQVKNLFTAMAKHFPGGMIAFDATNAFGLRGVNKEVSMAGNTTKSFFSLENPEKELESWSPDIVNVSEKDYMSGYTHKDFRPDFITRICMRLVKMFHISFIVHAEFAD